MENNSYLNAFLLVLLASYSLSRADAVELPSVEVIVNTVSGSGAPLSKTPFNAQTLKASDVAEQGANNVADLLNNSLGSVSVSSGSGNSFQNDVNYRGFQATSLLGAPVGLSVYFDGVRMNEPFGSIVNWDLMPMNAISRVNVLPGSNPMFGANTLGGALVIDTKNGKDNPSMKLNVLGGSFNRKNYQLTSGLVDQEHGSDYFFAGNYDKDNGFRSYSGSEVKQLFGKARWHDGITKIDLSLAYAHTHLMGTQSLPADMMSKPDLAYTWPDSISNQMVLLNLRGSHWLDDSHQLTGNVYFRESNSSAINSNVKLDDGCTNADGSWATSGNNPKCANMAPNGTAINSITGAAAQGLGFGRWTNSINTSLVDSVTHQKTLGTGFQWSNFENVWGRNNTLNLGAVADYSQINYQQNTYLARLLNYEAVSIANQEYGFTANGSPPSPSNPLVFNGSNVLSGVNLTSNTSNLNAYFTDSHDLSEKISVTLSGSYNLTNINQIGVNRQYLNDDGGYSWTDSVTGLNYYNPSYLGAYKYANSSPGFVSTLAPSGTAGPETSSLNGTHQYHRFNPAIGFNHHIDQSNGIFANYSESTRAPTSIELSCANPLSPCALPTGFNGDPDLKAVVAKTFEIGARGRFTPNTHWNVAIYDSKVQNDIQFISTSTTYGYFSNVGNTQRQGIEMGTQSQIDQLFLALNYGLVKAQYKSNFTTVAGANVISGDSIPGVANQALKIRARYRARADLFLGVNLNLVGSQWMHGNEDNSDPNGRVPGYGIVNLNLNYKINGQLSVYGLINNLFDKQYSTYGLSGQTSVYTLQQQSFLTPAAPRAIWVGLGYSFSGDAHKTPETP